MPLNAVTNKLTFKKHGLYSGSSYDRAVDLGLNDGQSIQTFADCAVSASSTPTVWMSIDLLHLYSVSKIKFLSRFKFGIGTEVYVGNDSIKSNGTTNHRCGKDVTIPIISQTAISLFTDFSCSPINWVQYVSIRRHGQDDGAGNPQYLQVCKVEVYYNENEGKNVTRTW